MVVTTIIDSILANWVIIIITVAVTLLTAFITNHSVKKRFKTLKQKDQQRALDQIRTIIEELIINNRESLSRENPELDELGLSAERIEDLIEATEREYPVARSILVRQT